MKISLIPSRADRWVPCPRSASLENEFQNRPNAAGREGTVAHKVMENMLKGKIAKPGDEGEFGIKITGDMIEGAAMLCDMVPISDSAFQTYIERLMPVTVIGYSVQIKPDVFSIAMAPTPVVYLWDYKYGFSQIEPSSWQFREYFAGIMGHFNLPSHTQFHMTVVQPRGYHRAGPVRTAVYTGSDVLHWIGEMKRSADQAQLGVNAPMNTGPQCKNCNGRHACSGLMAAAYNVFDETVRDEAVILTADQYGQELAIITRALEILNSRKTGIEAMLLAGMKNGQVVKGWHIEHSNRNRQWKLDAAQLYMLGDALGKDLRKIEPVTPAEAERRGIPESIVEQYAAKPPGEAKLVRTTAEFISGIFNPT